jgi:hypothetical protein
MAGMESNTTSPQSHQRNGFAKGRAIHEAKSAATGSADVICNVTGARAFTAEYDSPPLPVLAAFGAGALHQCRLAGSWDLERAVKENVGSLIRSFRSKFPDNPAGDWVELIFKFGPKAFLHAEDRRIVGYGVTVAEAERQVAVFTEKYRAEPEDAAGSFHLIKFELNHITTEAVPLRKTATLGEECLDLHYGDGFSDWHRGFAGKLRNFSNGLTIFEGSPGTGKTSYLRHLMGVLRDTHRFYFIPPALMSVLSDPKLIEFWSWQRRAFQHRKFVVILEDSEAALMTRASDNREQVSAILNLTDGMLADFLRLQIICTINCTSAEIDPALLRPGRLLCHRVFQRLNPAEATRLAESLGRTLPTVRDYSLAEVFAGDGEMQTAAPRIGFAA